MPYRPHFSTNSFFNFFVPPRSSFLATLHPSNTVTSTTVSSGRNDCCSKQTPLSFNVCSRGRKFFELAVDAMLSANAVVPLCQPMIPVGFYKFFVIEKSFVFSRVSKLSKCRQPGGDELTTSPLF